MAGDVEELRPKEFATGEKEGRGSAYQNDPIFFRIVALTLGAVAVGSLLSIAILSWVSYISPHGPTPWPVPESITALGSAAVGALAGLFTGSHTGK